MAGRRRIVGVQPATDVLAGVALGQVQHITGAQLLTQLPVAATRVGHPLNRQPADGWRVHMAGAALRGDIQLQLNAQRVVVQPGHIGAAAHTLAGVGGQAKAGKPGGVGVPIRGQMLAPAIAHHGGRHRQQPLRAPGVVTMALNAGGRAAGRIVARQRTMCRMGMGAGIGGRGKPVVRAARKRRLAALLAPMDKRRFFQAVGERGPVKIKRQGVRRLILAGVDIDLAGVQPGAGRGVGHPQPRRVQQAVDKAKSGVMRDHGGS